MTFDGRIEARFTVPTGVTISATNSGGGPTSVPLVAGTYFPSTFIAHVIAQLNATRAPATWVGSISTGPAGTGKTSIVWTGTGTYSIAWTDTNTRDMLGYTANLTAITQGVASVSTKQARGLWLPDCPLNLDCDTPRAPLISDALSVVSGRGDVTTLVGNTMLRHANLRWSHVLESKTWESAAVIANASWETFWKDAHLGQSTIPWFAPGSKLKIVDHAARTLGSDANAGTGVTGWVATKGPTTIEPKKVDASWTGLWRIELPELVSSG